MSAEDWEDLLGGNKCVLLKRLSKVDESSPPEYKQLCQIQIRGHVVKIGEECTINPKPFQDELIEVCVGENILEPVPPGVMVSLRAIGLGERVVVRVQSRYAYGSEGFPPLGIPPDADLEYDILMQSIGGFQKEPAEMETSEDILSHLLIYKYRGNEYFQWNKLDKALRCYAEGTKYGDSAMTLSIENENLQRERAACANNAAAVLERQGKFKEAKEATIQALLFDNRNVKALMRAARISMQQAEYEEARVALDLALESAPGNAAVIEADRLLREKVEAVKRTEKERWGGFLKPAPPGTAAAQLAKEEQKTLKSRVQSMAMPAESQMPSMATETAPKLDSLQEQKASSKGLPPKSSLSMDWSEVYLRLLVLLAPALFAIAAAMVLRLLALMVE